MPKKVTCDYCKARFYPDRLKVSTFLITLAYPILRCMNLAQQHVFFTSWFLLHLNIMLPAGSCGQLLRSRVSTGPVACACAQECQCGPFPPHMHPVHCAMMCQIMIKAASEHQHQQHHFILSASASASFHPSTTVFDAHMLATCFWYYRYICATSAGPMP